ncbi:MAG: hypothetical protein DRQ60_07080 [Gammaproteobacteria bacterium]|nr:MAG: hypothetical protein DRQ60_07080 [Gammaproteobacteria bacterium]
MNDMSKWFVVNVITGAREGTYKSYKTHRGAKNFAARLNAKTLGYTDWEVASEEFYIDVLSQRTTTVKNLLSGKDVTIPMVDLGSCVDPSTERFFCM